MDDRHKSIFFLAPFAIAENYITYKFKGKINATASCKFTK